MKPDDVKIIQIVQCLSGRILGLGDNSEVYAWVGQKWITA